MACALLFLLYYPLKQGLKHKSFNLCISKSSPVFTLLSIKTRIETMLIYEIDGYLWTVFTLLSIKTRIETVQLFRDLCVILSVFTLLSIKTRIETINRF